MVSLHRTLIICIIPLILGLATTIQAASYTSAINAYERGDYHSAFRQLNKLSTSNDPHAQYMLGRMYASGEGVDRDYVLAFKWLTLAADQGLTPARKLQQRVGSHLTLAEKKWARELIADHRHYQSRTAGYREYTDSATVCKTQRHLAKLGYLCAPIDGVMGKKTRRAIRKYQEDHQLKVDGRITIILLESLHMVSNGNQEPVFTQPYVTKKACGAKLRSQLRKLIRKGYRQNAAEIWYLQRLEELLQTSWSL